MVNHDMIAAFRQQCDERGIGLQWLKSVTVYVRQVAGDQENDCVDVEASCGIAGIGDLRVFARQWRYPDAMDDDMADLGIKYAVNALSIYLKDPEAAAASEGQRMSAYGGLALSQRPFVETTVSVVA